MIDIRCFRFDVSQILSTCGLRYVIDVNLKSSLAYTCHILYIMTAHNKL